MPYADISDPQTLNKYAYVRNNPLRYIDPDGHEDEDHAWEIVDATFTTAGGIIGFVAGGGGGLVGGGAAGALAGGFGAIPGAGIGAYVGAATGTATGATAGHYVAKLLNSVFKNTNDQQQASEGGDSRSGGGKTGRKFNEERRLEAKDQLAKAKQELADARKVQNKTKEQAAKARDLEKKVKHLQKKSTEKSEEHANQGQR